ncbi:MAG: ABC transporter permease [Saccharofermentans sp.]|nr:ABC transporter permease [Saccharofermentans sp.]
MRELLKNDLKRVFYGRIIYLAIGLLFVFSLKNVMDIIHDEEFTSIEYGVMDMNMFIVIALCAIIPMFTCNDFSSGMIRNKVAAGHPRHKIFLSGMITSVICALTLYASFAVAYFPVAIYHCGLGWGGYEPDPLQRFVAIVDSILIMIVIAVVAHTLSTIFRKKAATIVILIIANLIYGTFILPNLYMAQTQTMTDVIEEEVDGDYISETYQIVDNPSYLEKGTAARTTVDTVEAVMVVGHELGIAKSDDVEMIRFLLVDVAEIVVFTFVGIAIFNKKDIK